MMHTVASCERTAPKCESRRGAPPDRGQTVSGPAPRSTVCAEGVKDLQLQAQADPEQKNL
eukprot:8042672-Prorocentrum_lima.AAC.1